MVSTQVSGARSLTLNPGLNIAGGVHPRGPRAVSMPGMLMSDISIVFDMSIDCLFRCRGAFAVDMCINGIVMDISSDIVVDISSDIVMSFPIILMRLMSGDAAAEEAMGKWVLDDCLDDEDDVIDMEPVSSELIHKLVPQSRRFWGRHCTFPLPFASKLSTQ